MKIESLKQGRIEEILNGDDGFYAIPDYQRPYSWDEEHIMDFWLDISKSYENTGGSYFLGSFILIKEPGKYSYEVVDGQQRLTTIIIFLSVLRDYFNDNNYTDLANIIHDKHLNKDGRVRLSVRDVDAGRFNRLVLSGVSSLYANKSLKISSAYHNAIKSLRAYVLERGKERGVDDIISLYNYFIREVFVILVITDDIASAYTIFETINNRGKELLVEDLLKNFLLKKIQDEVNVYNKNNIAPLNFEQEKRQFIATWQRLENIGHDLSEMLNYHFSIVSESKKRGDLFKEITSYIRDENMKVGHFMSSWEESIEAYNDLSMQGDLSDEAYKNLLCLKQINHKHWVPVLLSAKIQGYTLPDLERLIFLLEKMYALYWIAGYNSIKVKQPSLVLIRDYIKKSRPISEIEEYINKRLAIDKLNRDFQEKITNNCYGRSWCRYVLVKYEYSLADNTVLKELRHDKIQVEHILPQSMDNEYWTSRFTEAQHEELVASIGNLTLLAGGIKEKRKSKNQAASNKPYPEKLKIYSGETLDDGVSALHMTNELAKFQDWTPQSISERSTIMVGRLKQLWNIRQEQINDELISRRDVDKNTGFSEDELTLLDEYKGFIEKRFGVSLISRLEDFAVVDSDSYRRSPRYYYNFYSTDIYGADGHADTSYLPLVYFSMVYRSGEEIFTLHAQLMSDGYDKSYSYFKGKLNAENWISDNAKSDLNCQVNLFDRQGVEKMLEDLYQLIFEMRNNFSEADFREEKNSRHERILNVGKYDEQSLRDLIVGFFEDSSFRAFAEILLTENRCFNRDEIKNFIYQKGLSDSFGEAGRVLNKISQSITREKNDFLRQFISYASEEGIGAVKDSYQIKDNYRGLIQDILDSTRDSNELAVD